MHMMAVHAYMMDSLNFNRKKVYTNNDRNSAKNFYSLFPGFWQSFISIEVCCIPALASSCKKQLTGFFVCLLFQLILKDVIKLNRNLR